MNPKTLVTLSSLALIPVGCTSESTEIALPPPGFALVFSDEFNEAAGTQPDSTIWGYDIGTGAAQGIPGWGNNELQYYTDRAEEAAMDGNGNLVLTASPVSAADRAQFDGAAYVSARLNTKGLFTQQYGRIEARIRVPSGAAFWPAFWMLGENIDEVGWPRTGEIDIMESASPNPISTFGTAHGPGYNGIYSIGSAYRNFVDGEYVNFSNAFYNYAVEWDPNRITWFVNDVPFHSVTQAESIAVSEVNCNEEFVPAADCTLTEDERWPFDQPFFMILNLAVGGDFVGNANPRTSDFPGRLEIDWIRVFERI